MEDQRAGMSVSPLCVSEVVRSSFCSEPNYVISCYTFRNKRMFEVIGRAEGCWTLVVPPPLFLLIFDSILQILSIKQSRHIFEFIKVTHVTNIWVKVNMFKQLYHHIEVNYTFYIIFTSSIYILQFILIYVCIHVYKYTWE